VKKKGGLVLDPLLKANPAIIVMTGNAYTVQKFLAVYNLPMYIDSSVIEFPDIQRQWAVALVR